MHWNFYSTNWIKTSEKSELIARGASEDGMLAYFIRLIELVPRQRKWKATTQCGGGTFLDAISPIHTNSLSIINVLLSRSYCFSCRLKLSGVRRINIQHSMWWTLNSVVVSFHQSRKNKHCICCKEYRGYCKEQQTQNNMTDLLILNQKSDKIC